MWNSHLEPTNVTRGELELSIISEEVYDKSSYLPPGTESGTSDGKSETEYVLG